jgi:hypothetical protein
VRASTGSQKKLNLKGGTTISIMAGVAPVGGLAVPGLPAGCIARYPLPESMAVAYAAGAPLPAIIEIDAMNYVDLLKQNRGIPNAVHTVVQADINIILIYLMTVRDCRTSAIVAAVVGPAVAAVVGPAVAGFLPGALAAAMGPVLVEIEARRRNLRATRDQDTLVPVVLAAQLAAGVPLPGGFPATRRALLTMTNAMLAPLEVYYGLAGVGRMRVRQRAFATAIGLPFM